MLSCKLILNFYDLRIHIFCQECSDLNSIQDVGFLHTFNFCVFESDWLVSESIELYLPFSGRLLFIEVKHLGQAFVDFTLFFLSVCSWNVRSKSSPRKNTFFDDKWSIFMNLLRRLQWYPLFFQFSVCFSTTFENVDHCGIW